MTRNEYNYWLANINNIGKKKIELLLRFFGDAEGVYNASADELMDFRSELCPVSLRFTHKDIKEIVDSKNPERIHEGYTKLIQKGIYFVTKGDEHYPERLHNIYDAPFALYYKGRMPDKTQKTIAIVGARDCSVYGRETAMYFARELAAKGIAVISGLARGIDSYAHKGALAADGISYAVLGCGIDICYPRENLGLYMDMQARGGIISEYAPGTAPIAGNFPMRNRIISGLADAILVVEARQRSGSLITADLGLEQGKDIFAIPGRPTDPLSAGCNNLIKMGAKLVEAPEDILEELMPDYKGGVQNDKKANNVLELNEEIVYSSLCLEPKHIEEIAQVTGLPVQELAQILCKLALRGLIRQTSKNYYLKQL
ncbi:MAG: DNA-protecting protein DprA [Clostridiales bacterium]|nr:DNA-protecting protein DprA [Clostridiales bacterium]